MEKKLCDKLQTQRCAIFLPPEDKEGVDGISAYATESALTFYILWGSRNRGNPWRQREGERGVEEHVESQ